MEKICISMGGSIFSRDSGFNMEYITALAKLIKKYKDYKFVIVVGGGYASRLYIEHARKVVSNNLILDEIGIAFTKINTLLFKNFLKDYVDVYSREIKDIDELKEALIENRVVVLGGLMPGITTDSIAVLACEATNCKRLINVSRESYVYTKNPKEKGAKRLDRLTHDQLIEIAFRSDARTAGSNFIFDLVASKLAKRSEINLYFVDDDVKNMERVLLGKPHGGSTVKD